uniref:Protein kinase domain-containing protein n=1 Tax=Plectus sambesii TaxID=2011161 RepID=A0A914UMR2_9BILA
MHGSGHREFNLLSLNLELYLDQSVLISSLDGWSKIEEIGEGSFGVVSLYSAPFRDSPMVVGEKFKVRLWNLNEGEKEDLKRHVSKFNEKVNTQAKASRACHQHIGQLIGCYWGSTKLILFTEYMENGSIKGQIVDSPLPEVTALKYLFQATQGVHFLPHFSEGRIIHRDIKCANLLLTRNWDVKLADFGLVYQLAVDKNSNNIAVCSMQVRQSLGCTLVEMLTGYPPHVDFWKKRKGLAPFFPGQQEEADSWEKLQHTGHQLVPNASELVQRLLDCTFIKNEAN